LPKEGTSRVRRVARHRRVRRRVSGVDRRPRLVVFRSLNHVYAQVIDDTKGMTVAAASSIEVQVRDQVDGMHKTGVSRLVGSLIARRVLDSGVTEVVFDRAGYKYHGRVKALADAAREGGLVF